MRLRVGYQHSQFGPILVHFMHYYSPFWGPRAIPRLTIPGVHLCVGHQHSQFWLTLPRFMVYYSLFWGPGAISIIDAPRGAFTCRSPAIVILFDSGLFRGLLFTILGSQSYFHIHNDRGAFTCTSSTVAILVDSGPFHGLLLTVLVSQSDFNGC